MGIESATRHSHTKWSVAEEVLRITEEVLIEDYEKQGLFQWGQKEECYQVISIAIYRNLEVFPESNIFPTIFLQHSFMYFFLMKFLNELTFVKSAIVLLQTHRIMIFYIQK